MCRLSEKAGGAENRGCGPNEWLISFFCYFYRILILQEPAGRASKRRFCCVLAGQNPKKMKNLFDTDSFMDTQTEQFDTLAVSGELTVPGGYRLERILSFGQATPPGEWYGQEWTEWVAVIRGTAVLAYEDGESVAFQPGDHLVIPANKRHRVTFASNDCLWLAFHYNENR